MNKKRRVAQTKSKKRKDTLKMRERVVRLAEGGVHAAPKPVRTKYELEETVPAPPAKEPKPKAAAKPKEAPKKKAEATPEVKEEKKPVKTAKPKAKADTVVAAEDKPKAVRKTTKKAKAE